MLLSLAGLIGSNGIQLNPNGPAASAGSVQAGPPGAGSTAGATGAQQPIQVNFAPEQKKLCLRLRQDQTVSTWVQVVVTPPPTKPDTANSQAPAGYTDASQANSGGPSIPTLAPPKFYLDMSGSRYFSPCTVVVSTLLGDLSWNPERARGIPILITSCRPNGGEGTLMIVGSPNQKGLHVTLRPRRSRWLSAAMITSLILAIGMCLVAARIVLSQGHKMTDDMGAASWDFSTSWASNITAFGTAFAFLLQLSVPDKPFFGTRQDYTFVAALASAIVAFAPAMHRLISASVATPPTAGATTVPEGVVGGFLGASVFTVWGSLLQCGVVLLIVLDLVRTATVYSPLGIMAVLAVGIGAAALISYCANTLLSTIALNAARTGNQTAPRRAKFPVNSLTPVQARSRKVSVL